MGQLIHREIEAFVNIGYRFTGGALIGRLAEHVLTANSPQNVMPGLGFTGPPVSGATHAALRAARYAQLGYPGPVGELIDAELRSYVDSGLELHSPALPRRLIGILAAQQATLPDISSRDLITSRRSL